MEVVVFILGMLYVIVSICISVYCVCLDEVMGINDFLPFQIAAWIMYMLIWPVVLRPLLRQYRKFREKEGR